ncbi:MAG: molybdopterin-binding protein [Promethearchaeota archaeon]
MIGNEILIGKTQDTNSNYLAKRITKYGHLLRRITTIGDDLNEISKALREIISHQPDLVIISGGLGPTFDDMTLQGVGIALNKDIKLNQTAYNSIKKAYDQAYKYKELH